MSTTTIQSSYHYVIPIGGPGFGKNFRFKTLRRLRPGAKYFETSAYFGGGDSDGVLLEDSGVLQVFRRETGLGKPSPTLPEILYIDGIPRNVFQAQSVVRALERSGVLDKALVWDMRLDLEPNLERIVKRFEDNQRKGTPRPDEKQGLPKTVTTFFGRLKMFEDSRQDILDVFRLKNVRIVTTNLTQSPSRDIRKLFTLAG